MKQYKIIRIGIELEDTENKLNELAKDGWELVCSYGYENKWLVMSKEKSWL